MSQTTFAPPLSDKSKQSTPAGRTSRLRIQLGVDPALATASLIAAAPIEALLSALSRDIAFIKDRLPGSTDLVSLTRLRNDLARALDEARRSDVWLSPKDVARVTGKGLSTVTKECRDHEQAIGAVRNGKRGWLIHWPTYDACMLGAHASARAA